MIVQEGFLIEFYHDKTITLAYCSGQHNSALKCITQEGKELKVPCDKLLTSEKYDFFKGKSKEEIKNLLISIVKTREEIKETIPLKDLWELSFSEKDSYSAKELAVFYFGEQLSSDEFSAMLRLLLCDRIYFKRKDEQFIPQTQDYVESVLKQISAEQSKKEKNESISLFFKDVFSGKTKTVPEDMKEAIESLIDVAVYKNESSKYKEVMSILSSVAITSHNAPAELLLKLGVFKEDENILLRYHKIERDFSPEITSECLNLPLISNNGYEDFTALNIYTVDDIYTKDIDDGLSIEKIENNYCIGVHIADASRFIEPDSAIDNEAKKRATSIYLPDETINMLPHLISEDKAGLIAGEPRNAISFFCTLDAELNLINFTIKKTIIKVSSRLTYCEYDGLFEQNQDISLMHSIAQKLLEKRISMGAVYAPFTRLSVHVTNGKPVIKKDDPKEPLQILVSEFMILANRSLGDFFVDNNIPAIFRNQEASKESIPKDLDYSEPYNLHKLRKYLKKVSLSTEPSGHFGLGIRNYVQATSPIRRYMDLILHRQIKHFLDFGKPLYSVEQLKELLLYLDSPRTIAETLERSSKHYWTLKYLENLGRTELRALVLRTGAKSTHVQLCETLLEAELTVSGGDEISAGQYLYVLPEIVWPSDHELKLSYCGKE